YRQGGVEQDLIFLVGERLGRGDSNRVAGMHAHRVEVFDGADDDAVVVLIADNLHLVLFPTDQRFVDQQLVGWRQVQTPGADFFKLFPVVGNAATGAAHGERGANDARETDLLEHLEGFFHAARDA